MALLVLETTQLGDHYPLQVQHMALPPKGGQSLHRQDKRAENRTLSDAPQCEVRPKATVPIARSNYCRPTTHSLARPSRLETQGPVEVPHVSFRQKRKHERAQEKLAQGESSKKPQQARGRPK